MSSCTYPNCLTPVAGQALICDRHRAARIEECTRMRGGPDYKPHNPDCTYGMHQQRTAYGQLLPGYTGYMTYAPCTECHYCGKVHHWVVAAA